MPSFPPLLGSQPHTLLLGSMPSTISLAENQYYANPQNAFWWITGQLTGFATGIPYHRRVAQIVGAGFAVWDVLFDCVRPGSLDSNIVKRSEQANDLAGFLRDNPTIGLIAFNGRAAQQIFMRHCSDVLTFNRSINTVLLPSSSPAHASVSRTEKLRIWQQSLGFDDDKILANKNSV